MKASDFDMGTEVQGEATPVEATTTTAKKKNTELKKKAAAALQESVAADPSYAERRLRLANSIEVINTLGFGKGGLIQTAPANKVTGEPHKVGATSAIVGYVIKNVGNEAIPVATTLYALDAATGKYVGTDTTHELKPGEDMMIDRKALAMLGMLPEFCMTLKNGTIVSGSADIDKKKPEEALASFYFKPSNPEEVRVHDDGFKIDIHDVQTDGDNTVYVVKEEFLPTFGFLMNKSEGKTRTPGAPKVNGAEMLAALLRKMVSEGRA